MKPLTPLLIPLALIAGCAGAPKLTPWRADALLAAIPAGCAPPASEGAAPGNTAVLPGGVSVVRSQERNVVLVAARLCVMTVDAATGATEQLPTRGDSIAPTMLDATSAGVAFSSNLSGTVRAINSTGAVTMNLSGLRYPLGVRLMPGGLVLVAENGAGRIIRTGPSDQSPVRLVADGLEGPVGIVVVDATTGYVTENLAGRVTLFRLDRFEKSTVVKGLKHPEGIALMPDGRLAVAEVGLRRLVAIDPKTRKIEVMADNLPVGLTSPVSDGDPYTITDVTAAPDGTLYISADLDRTVLRVSRRQ